MNLPYQRDIGVCHWYRRIDCDQEWVVDSEISDEYRHSHSHSLCNHYLQVLAMALHIA